MQIEDIGKELEQMKKEIERLTEKCDLGDRAYSRAVRLLDEADKLINSEEFLDKLVARIRNKQLFGG